MQSSFGAHKICVGPVLFLRQSLVRYRSKADGWKNTERIDERRAGKIAGNAFKKEAGVYMGLL